MEEYHDGDFEYSVIEALVEEIIDKYALKAHFYLESDKYDNTMSVTMIGESIEVPDDYSFTDEVQINALINLVGNLLADRTEAERNAMIALIYESVYEGIHMDDDDLFEDDIESDIE